MITFNLRELSELRQEVRTNFDDLKHKAYGIQQNQSLTSTRLGDLENAVALMRSQVSGLDAKVSGLDTKLNQLLGLLSGSK